MPDTIIVNSQYAEVTSVRDFAPGEHSHSPILNSLPAREFVTRYGSRWTGIRADGSMFCDPRGTKINLATDLEL